MNEDRPRPTLPDPGQLMAEAAAGGPGAALAARRAAILAERNDPDLARQALALASRLEPLDPAPRLALARMHAEAGELDAARTEAAAVLAEAIDQAARARAAFILGELDRARGEPTARGFYEQVLKIEDAILAANRGDPAASRWYARARGRLAELDAKEGAIDRARAGAEGALSLLRAVAANTGETPVLAADIADAEVRLGALELDTNQPSSARRRFDEAIGRYEALAVTEAHEPHWRAVLADAWALAAEADYVRGAPERAREAMDKALQARLRLAAQHPEEAWALAGTWRLRGALRAALGDADVAADSMAQARTLAEHLVLRAADQEAPARFLTHTLLDQADHALRANDLNLAREAADTARMGAERQAQAPDAHAAWFGDAAAAWDRLGEVARRAGSLAQAQDALARAVELRRLACERAPKEVRFLRGLAAGLVRQGDVALEAAAFASAQNAFNESISLRMRLLEAAPQDPRAAHGLAAALERYGLAAQAVGDTRAARAAWEDELALADRIFPPDDIEGLRFSAIVASHLVNLNGPDAEHWRQQALGRFDVLAKAGVLTEREAALRRKLWGG